MKRLLLAGGGHAHLEILRRLISQPIPEVEVTLVSTSKYHHYSGMVPGFVAGAYEEAAIAFDLEAICRKAGVTFLADAVNGLDPERREVHTTAGLRLPYELVSFNLGSLAAASGRPEVASAHLVKPISRAVQLRRKLLEEAASNPEVQVGVVGAGAAGFEMACAARSLLAAQGREPRVLLLDATDTILSGYSDRFRRRGARILDTFGVQVHLNQPVERVEPDQIVTREGISYPSHVTIWLTGAAAPGLFAASGLAVDPRGFLLVDDTLRSISNPYVLAVGDCATLLNYPRTPKAGVYSVRQAPFLWESLHSNLRGGLAPRYSPQTDFLSILNLCDGRALLRYKGVISVSRWAWILKDWIDRRFMRMYQSLLH